MAKGLITLSIARPGFFGLNTQNAGSILPAGWATKLINFVFDSVGRMACRKGTHKLNATAVSGSPAIRQVHEYIDASGNKLNIFAAGNKVYKEESGVITDISTNIGTTMTLPTADNWQFINFNGACVGFQESHAPITLATVGGLFIDSTGTQHNGTAALSAYGRMWTVLNNTLYYSDLLINDFASGSAGNFDLSKYWPEGMDEAVAIADFNGFLMVFGKNSILIYETPDVVGDMVLLEAIDSVGCIARDSIQVVGNDIMLLSNIGIQSVGRIIQNKSAPMRDMSYNVRDNLLNAVGRETKANIRSVYNQKEGFYQLSLPTDGISYIFDLKIPNEDGSPKVTTWDYAPTALMYSEGLVQYLAREAGFISTLTGFADSVDSDGTGGSSYLIDFEGVWNDFGDTDPQLASLLKIFKRASITASGIPSGTVNFKWAVDYSNTFTERQVQFAAATVARYGVATYNTTGVTYSTIGDFEKIKSNLSKSGEVVMVGVSTTILNASFALQRVDLQAKLGKQGI